MIENKNTRVYMKSLLKIAFSFLVGGICILSACDDSDDNAISGFTLDTEIVTLDATGGTEVVKVASGTKWIAKVDQPWLQIMPANGVGATECKIVVDTTLSHDMRQATITFMPEGVAAKKVEVNQQGYNKSIGISIKEVEVPNMGKYGKRFFDVSVVSNVDFDINIATDATKKDWVEKPRYQVNLNQGARPRTTKLRFNWKMNTDPKERTAMVSFDAKEGEIESAVLKVIQEAAPEITDTRSGDSLALIIIQEKINTMAKWDTSEKMEYWRNVILWEKKDKEVKENPAMLGRVRSVGYTMISTKEELPEEVAKLTYLETLSFGSNTNTMLLFDLSPGTAVCELKHLKHLTIYAYGITKLPDELTKLGGTLESLDLSSNNFNSIPTILTPTNFPKLTSLSLSGMRRYGSYSSLKTETRKEPGLMIDVSSNAFKNLLKWENLKVLNLSYNLLYGKLPANFYTFDAPIRKYTDEDINDPARGDTLKTAKDVLVGKVFRVLPNAIRVSMNLNFITGEIPDWVKYHPNLSKWDPFTLFFTQDIGYDKSGNLPGFTNEPANLDYYYELYPLNKPKLTEE